MKKVKLTKIGIFLTQYSVGDETTLLETIDEIVEYCHENELTENLVDYIGDVEYDLENAPFNVTGWIYSEFENVIDFKAVDGDDYEEVN